MVKRSIIIIVGIFILITLTVVTLWKPVTHKIKYYQYDMPSYEISNFREHKSAFETVAQMMQRYYGDESKSMTNSLYSVGITEQRLLLKVNKEDGTTETREKELTNVERDAFQEVAAAFSECRYSGFLTVSIKNDKQVAFFSAGGPYALVFVSDDKEPNPVFGNLSTAKCVFTDKLSDNWYQMLVVQND